MWQELIKHEIPLATNNWANHISAECISKFLSCRTCKFWKAHRIIRCFNSLLKGLLSFLRLWVFTITANQYSWKIGTWGKSPDSRGPDNRGSTVSVFRGVCTLQLASSDFWKLWITLHSSKFGSGTLTAGDQDRFVGYVFFNFFWLGFFPSASAESFCSLQKMLKEGFCHQS